MRHSKRLLKKTGSSEKEIQTKNKIKDNTNMQNIYWLNQRQNQTTIKPHLQTVGMITNVDNQMLNQEQENLLASQQANVDISSQYEHINKADKGKISDIKQHHNISQNSMSLNTRKKPSKRQN